MNDFLIHKACLETALQEDMFDRTTPLQDRPSISQRAYHLREEYIEAWMLAASEFLSEVSTTLELHLARKLFKARRGVL